VIFDRMTGIKALCCNIAVETCITIQKETLSDKDYDVVFSANNFILIKKDEK
jgi:hypothetical protein